MAKSASAESAIHFGTLRFRQPVEFDERYAWQ
jgi:hypothetical protein